MKANVGSKQRLARYAIALLIYLLYFADVIHGHWAVLFLMTGVYLVFTGIIHFCPINYIITSVRENNLKS